MRFFTLAIGVIAFVPLFAQSSYPHLPPMNPRGYVCYRAAAPLTIDGRLDDVAWQLAPWTDFFVDIEGDGKPTPALATRVKMLWDDTYFYIGAELAEPQVWATLTEHDSVIFHDNDFEVFIDPNADNHEYYEFEINALGTFWDLLLPRPYKDGGVAVNGWEIPGLKAAVAVAGTLNDPRDVDTGWSVELAFPWHALGELARRPSPPHDGDQWRVNFSRVEWPTDVVAGVYQKVSGAKEQNWVWSPQGVVDMHRPEMWGYVQFSTRQSGPVAFVPDASLPARRWLHEIYYAERDYRRQHQRWAANLAELGVIVPAASSGLSRANLQVAGSQFEASVDLKVAGLPAQHWHIRQDSLIWHD